MAIRKEEAIYPIYNVDQANQKLSGANHYVLRFPPGQLPPVNSFWSLTMYDMPESLLVANPINRYLINSPMLPQFKRDADGGLTLADSKPIAREGQGGQLAARAEGPFRMYLRLYWPKAEALNGTWTKPPLQRVG